MTQKMKMLLVKTKRHSLLENMITFSRERNSNKFFRIKQIQKMHDYFLYGFSIFSKNLLFVLNDFSNLNEASTKCAILDVMKLSCVE